MQRDNSIQNYIISNKNITKSWSHKIPDVVDVVGFEYNGKPQIVHGDVDKNLMIFHSEEEHNIVKKIFKNMIGNFGDFAIFTRFGNFFWILRQSIKGPINCK